MTPNKKSWLTRLTDLNDSQFLIFYIAYLAIIIGLLSVFIEWLISRRLEGLFLNLGTELIGAGAISFLLSDAIKRSEKAEEEKREAEENLRLLIIQMGSEDNPTALNALRILRRRDWLEDGSLRRADLTYANLQNASLHYADLQGAWLSKANLHGSNLRWAALDMVDLADANLQEASLEYASLQEANLTGANLQDANLTGANLQGAFMRRAILQGAILPDRLKLPDGDSWRDVFSDWLKDKEGLNINVSIAKASLRVQMRSKTKK